MALALVGLAERLRAAGLAVIEYSGWKERTQRDGGFTPRGVMIHHDASAPGNSPGVPAMMANLANDGAQTWVDRRGVWYLIAAGRMWHAGEGTGFGFIPPAGGNTYSVGVETDHTIGEDWPRAQYSSLVTGTAVLCDFLGVLDPFKAVCGHKEYRRSNPDPDGINMESFRNDVHSVMNGDTEEMTPEQSKQLANDIADAINVRVLWNGYGPDSGDRNLVNMKIESMNRLIRMDDRFPNLLNALELTNERLGQVVNLLIALREDGMPPDTMDAPAPSGV